MSSYWFDSDEEEKEYKNLFLKKSDPTTVTRTAMLFIPTLSLR